MDAQLNPQTSLITAQDVIDQINETELDEALPGLILPVVAVRDAVYFPGAHFPLLASRERSVRAIEQSQQYHDGQVLLVTQRDISDEASADNLVNVGVLATIENVAWLQDGIARVTLSAGSRVVIRGYVASTPTLVAAFDCITDVESEVDAVERQALARLVVEGFELLVEEGVISHPDALAAVSGTLDPSCISDQIGPYLPTTLEEKVALLSEVDPGKRLNMIHSLLIREKHVSAVRQQIRERLDNDFERVHRADILREQLKAIQAELDIVDPREDGNIHATKLAADSDIPESVRKVILEEISRYERLPSNSTESSLAKDRIDMLMSLPWTRTAPMTIDIPTARSIFEDRHSGLASAKKRIYEYLAVRKQAGTAHTAPILCFVGVPGVGKTSLATSIASVLNIPFIRIALGGVRDEAEIRGHRRTYTGAYPGHFAEALREAKVINPLILLDEIDKLGKDRGGDPASALLEVLDPEQNHEFHDHFVDVPLNLSQVTFIATANNLDDIPEALRDRMEVVEFAAYSEDEKLDIAQRHLVPGALRRCGLGGHDICFTYEAVQSIIRDYTHEGGVRGLRRQIDSIMRQLVLRLVEENTKLGAVTADLVVSILGRSARTRARALPESEVGSVTGMVATSGGGDLVQIESQLLPSIRGEQALEITGQLGSVMQESARTAWTWVKAYLVESSGGDQIRSVDAHVHVPCGAVQKDGASAGLAMAISLISAYKQIPVRADMAVTGEISLRGRIIPVGGIAMKLVAAHGAGIRHVVIPEGNVEDLEELPVGVRNELSVYPVSTAMEAVQLVLAQA